MTLGSTIVKAVSVSTVMQYLHATGRAGLSSETPALLHQKYVAAEMTSALSWMRWPLFGLNALGMYW